MKLRLSSWLPVLATGLALGALAGCASAPSSQEADPKAAQAHAATGEKSLAADLRKGMTQEQVRELLGTPAEIRQVEAPEGKAERWIYRRRVNAVVDQQATGTQDVPYVDPITGQMRMIPEPVYSQVTTVLTEELHLLWLSDELIHWNTLFRNNRSYEK